MTGVQTCALPISPADERPASGSTYVEVARTFVRVTNTNAVEDELRGMVTDVDARYPLPIRGDTYP